ncbi:MAG: tetratricopeptide repeat protein [Candidatus Lokiarchaeota archaeon]|nr:tetratricopeptide repeat protein [Candidatus Lokiarchaeota archaeon]
MALNVNEQWLKKANYYLSKKKYNDAIKIYKNVIRTKPPVDITFSAYLGLGDALKYIYELELAEKFYQKALSLVNKIKKNELSIEIERRIENVYVMKQDRDLNPIQIEFFMRSIMSFLSKFGKTDWF